jgi:DNA-binding MarR family transcriptional regulator
MDFYCYNTALRTAARQLTAKYDEAVGDTGIGAAQFTLLKTLAAHEPLALTDLGTRLRLDRSTIGRNVRVLERAGLLKLGTSADGRETAVELTKVGHTVLSSAEPLWEQAQRDVERRLGKDGAKNLRILLKNLEDETEI